MVPSFGSRGHCARRGWCDGRGVGHVPENSSNHAFYASPELDATLDAAHSERDPQRRVTLYEQAEDIVLRDAPWAFVYTPVSVSVTQPYVRAWVPHPVWNDWVGDAWLDLPRRRAAVTRARDRRVLGPLAALHRPWEALPP
jgi:ABC-type transport system substrate-binding protein